jgi:phenylalanyl-tRNA synthetase beta chain
MIGLEVEGVSTVGYGMDEVVVALVQEKEQHPNADKLSLCQVNNGKEIVSVVCGAQNFKAGDRVALAQVGAVLPGDFRIKRSKIRGSESYGMLCSERELGLADESDGILVLSQELPLGVPLFEALGMKDTIFEIGLTPNRADCLSVIGIAREIAAKLGKKLNFPSHAVPEEGTSVEKAASVRVEDPDLCPRYTARYVAGCTIAPSPAWMVSRLKAVGIRSINNVVDITNYVLMEYGHPLHAFDHSLLAGGAIIVRRAVEGERFNTLDGQERILSSSDLTIRDTEKVVALAGIMGGENSEIRETTSDILIESACFVPAAIRRTSKRLGMHTESSHRFERGTDISILPHALDRAASLMAELAGGKVAPDRIDVYPDPVQPRTIPVRLDRIAQILGIQLSCEKITEIFRSLEFSVELREPRILHVTVPTFRVDIEREIDLIEEVARMNGYDKIPATMPLVHTFSERPSRHQMLEKKLRDLLVSQGLSEVITYSFIHPDAFGRILLGEMDPRRNVVSILNPLTEEQSVMRTTLLPGLLETAARNISFRLMSPHLFEMRRIYLADADADLPVEPVYAAGILSGARDPEGWHRTRESVDFYDVKGVVENILDTFAIKEASFEACDIETFYHPGKSCTVLCKQEKLGSFGELHPTVLENFGIEIPVYYFELNFEKLASLGSEVTSVTAPPRFPDTSRDIAMLVGEDMVTGTVLDCIRGNRIKEMENVELFDLYTGSGIPEGQKSIAVRIRYRSQERTLTDEEVNLLHQRVLDNLLKKLNITIR